LIISHPIILDLDNPQCLYCNRNCDTSGTTFYQKITDTFSCNYCNETISVTYESIYSDFIDIITFSCLEIQVSIDLEKNIYGLKKINSEQILIWIPQFDFDFSNRHKLFEKLNTYIIFS
jgi:hypothetical protein